MLNVGFDSYIAVTRIIGVVPYISAKIKSEVTKRKHEAGTQKTFLIDCTKNHVIKSVIVCDDGTYILSAISPETLVRRLNNK